MAPTIVLARHGETAWNAEGRVQGRADQPISAAGVAQAERNGRVLRARFPEIAGFDFVASPLGRTRVTMEILRRAIGLEPTAYRIDPRLIELTYGAWEGRRMEAIAAETPAAVAARETDKWGFVPPGGGESYAEGFERLRPFVEALRGDTVVVTHAGVIRILMAHLIEAEPRSVPNAPVPHDRVLVCRDGEGNWM